DCVQDVLELLRRGKRGDVELSRAVLGTEEDRAWCTSPERTLANALRTVEHHRKRRLTGAAPNTRQIHRHCLLLLLPCRPCTSCAHGNRTCYSVHLGQLVSDR